MLKLRELQEMQGHTTTIKPFPITADGTKKKLKGKNKHAWIQFLR